VPAIVEAEESDGTLFPARTQAFETLARLIEKLTARLGPEAAMRIERVADYRPERSWREVRGESAWRAPAGPASSDNATTTHTTRRSLRNSEGRVRLGHADAVRTTATRCTLGPRPAWLLSQPQPLQMRGHHVVYETPLDMVAGPERIETGWWDDATITRDYYIAENAAGRLLWVFRERLPKPGKPLWYLQGLFG
jgi:protein ImuB